MKQAVFSNGNGRINRDVLIRIDDRTIYFYFNEDYQRHENWLQNEIEYRELNGVDKLSDEEKYNTEFYWIDKKDWHKSKTENLERGDNWHNHMEEKNWFTAEMERFLDLNTY